MNQDFALLATPANARRLLMFRRCCRLTVPSDIAALAVQDTIDENAFDPMVCQPCVEKHTITQFLLDCGLRGVVQADYHPTMTPLSLLNALRLANPARIIIITERRLVWTAAITALSLSSAALVRSVAALEDAPRDAVIVFEHPSDIHQSMSQTLTNVTREFPRFIIFDPQQGFERLTHWSIWARGLFPGMPHPLLPRLLRDVPSD